MKPIDLSLNICLGKIDLLWGLRCVVRGAFVNVLCINKTTIIIPNNNSQNSAIGVGNTY